MASSPSSRINLVSRATPDFLDHKDPKINKWKIFSSSILKGNIFTNIDRAKVGPIVLVEQK